MSPLHCNREATMARWERQLVNSVPASAFDVAARERGGELLRVTRDSNPTRLTAGTVVEFIHNGQLRCGCLKATPVGRRALQVMDCQGQERCLRADKILHHATEQVAVKPQDRGLEQLRLIDRQRAISAARSICRHCESWPSKPVACTEVER